MQACHDANQPLDRTDVKELVRGYLQKIGRTGRFHEDRPGKVWMRGFLKRHPNLALRGGEVLTQNRSKSLSQPIIREFYEKVLIPTFVKCDIKGVEDADAVFNLDEIGFTPNHTGGPVLARRGAKNVYQLAPNAVKKMTTVLWCCSAAGRFLPPLTIYKGKYLQSSHTVGGPKGAVFSVSDSGWMEAANFEQFIEKVFLPHTAHLKHPLVLIFDGHGSHLTWGTVQKCMEADVHLICLPPHSSHALQPCDVGVFRPMKVRIKKYRQ